MTHTDTPSPSETPSELAAPVVVEFGVKGAVRIIRREYRTLTAAKDAADRWRRSNSIGSYWAEIELPPEGPIYVETRAEVLLGLAVNGSACRLVWSPSSAAGIEAAEAHA